MERLRHGDQRALRQFFLPAQTAKGAKENREPDLSLSSSFGVIPKPSVWDPNSSASSFRRPYSFNISGRALPVKMLFRARTHRRFSSDIEPAFLRYFEVRIRKRLIAIWRTIWQMLRR